MKKCKDCGLLGGRNLEGTGAIEVSDYTRANGCVLYGGQKHPAGLFCYGNSDEFSERIEEINSSSGQSPAISIEIAKEHSCTEFMSWQKGKSPKEHSEMELVKKIENEYARHQNDLERRHRELVASHWKQRVVTLIAHCLISIITTVGVLVSTGVLPFWNIPK